MPIGLLVASSGGRTAGSTIGGIDLNTLVSWAQIGALVVAIIGLILTLRWQTRLAQFSATTENIWRFDEQWHSPEFRSLRVRASRALGKHELQPPVIDIWNFYEMLAILCRKGAVDKELVRNKFGNSVVRYWYLSNSLLRLRREKVGDPSLWVEFDKLKGLMQEMGVGVPTGADLNRFLSSEGSLEVAPPGAVGSGSPEV